MADKKVEAITSRDVDFAQWYTDIVTKAELIDYSSLKGFTIMRPYAWAIWENIQKKFDDEFKRTGHDNVSMPLLIPESMLQKEKDLVEGFAPEVAWVTHGGSEKLEERLCIRPTSETVFCDHFAHVVQSYRDLPKKYNQWCSVVRWEKTTRPFLRGREFHWQEGHTLHETEQEAIDETLGMLDIYADVAERCLAMPVIKGQKTESDKFAGAVATYCIESMMHDGKALQAGTSHFFGQKFAAAYDIQFTGRDNKLHTPWQTSWGVSTRLIGGIIMTHGDDNGLRLPPEIAPIQAVVVPVASHKPGVTEAAEKLVETLVAAGIRAKGDFSDNSPGWKFAEYEMKGVPLRIEIGPRDLEAGVCMFAHRTGGDKYQVKLDGVEQSAKEALAKIQQELYDQAKENMEKYIYEADTLEEAAAQMEKHAGFVKMKWCGDPACEEAVKDRIGIGSRCIPFEQDKKAGVCPICGKPANTTVYWGLAY